MSGLSSGVGLSEAGAVGSLLEAVKTDATQRVDEGFEFVALGLALAAIFIDQGLDHLGDALKNHFREEVTKDEWIFIKDKLKPFFNIL